MLVQEQPSTIVRQHTCSKNFCKSQRKTFEILLLHPIALWYTCFLVNFGKLFQNSSFTELIRATAFAFTTEGSIIKDLSPMLKWVLFFLTALLRILFFVLILYTALKKATRKTYILQPQNSLIYTRTVIKSLHSSLLQTSEFLLK